MAKGREGEGRSARADDAERGGFGAEPSRATPSATEGGTNLADSVEHDREGGGGGRGVNCANVGEHGETTQSLARALVVAGGLF